MNKIFFIFKVLADIVISCFAGMGVLFISSNTSIAIFYTSIVAILLYNTSLISFVGRKRVEEEERATKITREVYYKPIKLPAKPKKS
jgi:sorbitol-specific phosphotransferase system component IIC